jgi:hypothetical protein
LSVVPATAAATSHRIAAQAARIVDACIEATPPRHELTGALGEVSRIESWLAGRRAELVRKLAEHPGSFPEADIAEATGCTLNAATKETDRATMLDRANVFADALDAGDIRPGHVDALTRATKHVGAEHAARLLDQQDELARVAANASIRDFEQHLKRTTQALTTEADDDARLDQQRRNTRLRTWTDRTDGMWCLSGRFDPETGRSLHTAIHSAVTSLFTEAAPHTAPDDPLEREQHLTALALARIVNGDAPTATGNGDPIVVVDATATIPTSVAADLGEARQATIDWGIPIELPRSVLRDIFNTTDPDVVIVANGVILHAAGRLDLGRTSRLASRDQRRALRGLYSTCAIPGCAVHYDRCKLHHVIWWRHGGRTDLDNLLPVCQHHHTKLHNDDWQLTLGPHRDLTVRLPDGNVLRTGPPKHRAA